MTGGKLLRRPGTSVAVLTVFTGRAAKGRRFRQIEAVGRLAAAHNRGVLALSVIVIAAEHRCTGHDRTHQATVGTFGHLCRGHTVLHLAGLQLIHKPACAAVDCHTLGGQLIVATFHYAEQIAIQTGDCIRRELSRFICLPALERTLKRRLLRRTDGDPDIAGKVYICAQGNGFCFERTIIDQLG